MNPFCISVAVQSLWGDTAATNTHIDTRMGSFFRNTNTRKPKQSGNGNSEEHKIPSHQEGSGSSEE